MKRFLSFVLLTCLLLSGCKTMDAAPASEVVPTETQAAAVPTQQTAPVQTQPEMVTVYLLEKAVLSENGYTEYFYDEHYNIDYYRVYTIEDTPLYTAYFEEKDSNGMAGRYRTEWMMADLGETHTLTYHADGKLAEEQIVGDNYSGCQYDYDEKGNISQKREYHEGNLQSVADYEYSEDTLVSIYCQDAKRDKVYACIVEDGRIVEKVIGYTNEGYSYLYDYDEHGNLVLATLRYGGKEAPAEEYFYRAVEVEVDRLPYLQSQQSYILAIP